MSKRLVISIVAILAICQALSARQIDTLHPIQMPLDTAKIMEDYSKINDYSMLGVTYGMGFASCDFDPMRNVDAVFMPLDNVGITYTLHCKLFGYMPYFAFQASVLYAKDGYKFKQNENSGYMDNILYAYKTTIETIEIPLLAQFHYDFWKMKVMADIGVYGGYRFAVHREYLSTVPDSRKTYENSFHPNETKWDYGIKGGGGFALIFDPIELHIMCFYKYSWCNLHQPNVDAHTLEHTDMSKYYYKWSYPTNLSFSIGIHYQLTRRVGKMRAQIRQEAREDAIRILTQAQKQADNILNAENETDNGKNR